MLEPHISTKTIDSSYNINTDMSGVGTPPATSAISPGSNVATTLDRPASLQPQSENSSAEHPNHPGINIRKRTSPGGNETYAETVVGFDKPTLNTVEAAAYKKQRIDPVNATINAIQTTPQNLAGEEQARSNQVHERHQPRLDEPGNVSTQPGSISTQGSNVSGQASDVSTQPGNVSRLPSNISKQPVNVSTQPRCLLLQQATLSSSGKVAQLHVTVQLAVAKENGVFEDWQQGKLSDHTVHSLGSRVAAHYGLPVQDLWQIVLKLGLAPQSWAFCVRAGNETEYKALKAFIVEQVNTWRAHGILRVDMYAVPASIVDL